MEDVHVSFDGIRVLNGLSLHLEPGELRFLIGPNGAGKTTLLDMICGLLRPQRGRILFGGQDVCRLEPHQLVQRGLGRKFQTPVIFSSLSVRQNVECAGQLTRRRVALAPPTRRSVAPARGQHPGFDRPERACQRAGWRAVTRPATVARNWHAAHMLEIHGLTDRYGDGVVLSEVDLSIEADRAACLLGRNGVGKTTLIKAVMGLLRPRSGHIVFEGRDITRLTPHAPARLGIGYVPQGRMIFPQLSVTENLLIGLEAAGGSGSGAAERLASVHALFPVLREMGKRQAGMLFGRAAAAAGDWPRADCQAAAAGPGRTNGGHSAVDRAGAAARAPQGAR